MKIALVRSLCLSCLFCWAISAQSQVVISEFMASNSKTLADENGDFSDWVELFNSGPAEVNLGGWFLTDSAAQLTKWRFPAVTLGANGYLVVFASGKDRAVPGAQLHTSFNLAANGEYLALVQSDGKTVASEFAPTYPEQFPDISYGVLNGTSYYFSKATPGAPN